jgi:hypothetical protein
MTTFRSQVSSRVAPEALLSPPANGQQFSFPSVGGGGAAGGEDALSAEEFSAEVSACRAAELSSLSSLLSNALATQSFGRFLVGEWAYENLQFWEEIRDLKAAAHEASLAIARRFVWKDADTPLALSSGVVDAVTRDLSAPQRVKTAFDYALKEVQALLQSSFLRFVKNNDALRDYIAVKRVLKAAEKREKEKNKKQKNAPTKTHAQNAPAAAAAAAAAAARAPPNASPPQGKRKSRSVSPAAAAATNDDDSQTRVSRAPLLSAPSDGIVLFHSPGHGSAVLTAQPSGAGATAAAATPESSHP